jgi:cell division protein FtsW
MQHQSSIQHPNARKAADIRHPTQGAPDYVLLALVIALSFFGLVMVFSSSFFMAINAERSTTHYVLRQAIAMVIGGAGLLVAQRTDYRFWRRMALPLFGVTLALLIVVLLLPDERSERGGAERWIAFGGFQFQPTEIAKFALIVYLAAWLMGRGDKLRSTTVGLLPFGLIVGAMIGIMALQRNVSSAVILTLIAVSVYFAAGASLIHLGAGLAGALGVGWLMVQSLSHARARLAIFQDPWLDAQGGGFQPIHSLYALASGGWFGRGLGQGRQKFLWLPSAHADAIFGVIGEELGLIGTLAVVFAFVFLAYRGYRIAARATDPFAALLAVGITSWIIVQAFLNMAVVSSLIPYTGQTLPFISYGGTSVAMCLFAMGVLLNISKHVNEQPAEPERKSRVRSRETGRPQRRLAAVRSALARVMRRGDRGARVSSPRRSVGFERTAKRSSVTVDERGWRRLSGNNAQAKRPTQQRTQPQRSGSRGRPR